MQNKNLKIGNTRFEIASAYRNASLLTDVDA